MVKNTFQVDFHGSPVVKNLPAKKKRKNLSANAGDMGSIPGWRTKIPHATTASSNAATKKIPQAARNFKDPACHS